MSTSKIRRLTLSMIFTLVTALTAMTAQAGYYYESVTNTRGAGPNSEQKVKGWVEGDSARVEFVTGDRSGPFARGNYLVTTDGGENVYLVNPGDETYAAFDLEKMMASLGQAMEMMEKMGDMVTMEFTDATSEQLLEEPGEPILGYSTTHYRVRSGFTMVMGIMGMNRETRNETVADIWATNDLDAAGFNAWLRPVQRMNTGNDDIDKVLGQQMEMIKGYPLKMVMETSSQGAGPSGTTTTTMDVTVLREEPVADVQFTWPDSYTETELLPDVGEAMRNAN